MENLFNEPWGQLDYDQKQKRLLMKLNNSTEEQVSFIHREIVKAVKERDVETLISDIRNRTGSTDKNIESAMKHVKEAMNNGLKRLAILRSPTDKHEQQLTSNFISKMGKGDQIRFFDNQEDAISWLESGEGQRYAA